MKRLISSILFPIALTAALPVGAQTPCDTFGEPEVSAGIVEELVIAENAVSCSLTLADIEEAERRLKKEIAHWNADAKVEGNDVLLIWSRDNKGDSPGTAPIHALVFPECQSSPSRASNDGLQPGETIWVCNAQHIVKTEDTEVRIQADGTATLPIIGAVRLAGLTISEAERTVQDAYRVSGVYTHLQVRILREQANRCQEGLRGDSRGSPP